MPAATMPDDKKFERSDTVSFQRFLDSKHYSRAGILRYERIFGEDFITTGGREMTDEILQLLHPRPGQKVLDVGCGIGGSAFFMASHYNVSVEGIDLSKNMLEIAQEKIMKKYFHLKEQVVFKMQDVTTADYPDESFDVIYSRDTFLHIEDKKSLFLKFHKWLKPGGRLLITDYCKGDLTREFSEEFQNYVAERRYHLLTVTEYGRLLESIFPEVWADDRTETFLAGLQKELHMFEHHKASFIQEFSEKDFEYLHSGWEAKIKRVLSKEQCWGLFLATKER